MLNERKLIDISNKEADFKNMICEFICNNMDCPMDNSGSSEECEGCISVAMGFKKIKEVVKY